MGLINENVSTNIDFTNSPNFFNVFVLATMYKLLETGPASIKPLAPTTNEVKVSSARAQLVTCLFSLLLPQ